ncbi:MAG: hypothetical protein LBT00_14045 [Spirochaetaceae bacterium]|jgi:hypothetical protein|nr:hypothetical protein [Spirochaetaceae bacterium]
MPNSTPLGAGTVEQAVTDGVATPTSTPPLGGYRLASGPTSLRTRRVKQSRRGGLPTGLLLFTRNDGRGRALVRKRLPTGIATPTSTPPLGGYRLTSGPTSLRTRRVKQSRRGGLPTGLLHFARNDGRGRVLFSKRQSAGRATPQSTPLGWYRLAGDPTLLRSEQDEAIQTRRPPHWITSLGNVPLARNDARGWRLGRNRPPMGIAAPRSTPPQGGVQPASR